MKETQAKATRRLLVIADSPTQESGFGRVSKNLIAQWIRSGAFKADEIEVWGIGFTGWPHSFPFKIYPGQCYEASNWSTGMNLLRLGNLILNKRYSHVWVMQDLFLLSSEACMDTLGAAIEHGRKEWGMETICYFPVDAPVDAWWCKFLNVVDRAVAYTEYGRDEVAKHTGASKGGNFSGVRILPSPALAVGVVPHGTDTNVYRPLVYRPLRSLASRMELFAGDGVEWHEEDFLIVNVNQNQRRKGALQTLQVFKRLRDMMPMCRFKLYMHMRSVNEAEGVDLKIAARALGLPDVMFGDGAFSGGKALLGEDVLNKIYNAADLMLTTTMGEGWGLSLTEAMAAGCPVAGPRHTSLQEIIGDGRGVMFGCLGKTFLTMDMSRLRPLADVDGAALQIANAIDGDELATNARLAMAWIARPEFRWESVAAKFYPGAVK